MSPSRVDVAREFIQCLNDHNAVALAELMSEDHTTVNLAGRRAEGRDVARAYWDEFLTRHPDYNIRLSQVIASRTAILLFGRCQGSDLPDEVEAMWPRLWVLDVSRGEVVSWRAYGDRPDVRKEVWPRKSRTAWLDAGAVAEEINADLRALLVNNASNRERVRRGYHQRLRTATVAQVMEVAHRVLEEYDQRGTAYALIRRHPLAMRSLNVEELERLGQGMDSWGDVDSFGLVVAGPAWRQGKVGTRTIQRWARSEDRWWRRAALVCTVALNVKARGGTGDPRRTYAIARLLVDDRDDMVIKALSWALRDLIQHDREGVEAFLQRYDRRLAARVKREVRHKLETGLKTPRR